MINLRKTNIKIIFVKSYGGGGTEGLLNTEFFSHDLSTDGKSINNHTTYNFLFGCINSCFPDSVSMFMDVYSPLPRGVK